MMAELPEITKFAGQMNETFCGKSIRSISILQEKCTNVSAGEFQERVAGSKIKDVRYVGKWIITSLNNGENIVLSLGMGADILYAEKEKDMPEKHQVKVIFTDGTGYTVRFWWFGKFLLVSDNELKTEPNTKDIGMDPFDERFTLDYFSSLLEGKKTQVKAFLMDQKNIGGIGNMYMHDILFKAKVHPQKKISELNGNDIERLYESIREVLIFSKEKGAFYYESDLFGKKGGFTMEHFLVGYKEDRPCPECGEKIISIKIGSTSAFICPKCQKL
jgi:formamidopyrimidine-DNA glycosylase